MKKPLIALLSSISLAACCIARGTLVSTPRGRRPIEDLIEQDTLWSIHPETGERVASHVIAIARATREVMRLGGDDFTLTCTTDHPLYDPSTGSWAPAGDWVLGNRSALLFVPDDGASRIVTVQLREVFAGLAEVIDLTVQHELHNFVAAGVLVHNKSLAGRECKVDQSGVPTTVGEQDSCSLPDGGDGMVSCTPTGNGFGTCK